MPDLARMNGFKDVTREIPTEDDLEDAPTVVSGNSSGTGAIPFPESGLSEEHTAPAAPSGFDPSVSS